MSHEYGKVVLVEQPGAAAWQVILDDTTGLGEVEMAVMVCEPPPEISIVGKSVGMVREPVELEVALSGTESSGLIRFDG